MRAVSCSGGLRAGGGHGGLQQPEALLREGLGGLAGDGLDAAHARADGALAGDDEAADLAGGAAVRAAAELVAVALDPDGAHGLAVLLVEEGVRAGRDGLGHAHGRWRHGAVLADDAPHLVLDAMALLRGQAPVEGVVEAQVVGRHERARPGARPRRACCAGPGAGRACRCGCASCGRGGRDRPRRPSSWPSATRPCSLPWWTMRPATGRCVSSTVKTTSPAASRRTPRSPIWPPPSA